MWYMHIRIYSVIYFKIIETYHLVNNDISYCHGTLQAYYYYYIVTVQKPLKRV